MPWTTTDAMDVGIDDGRARSLKASPLAESHPASSIDVAAQSLLCLAGSDEMPASNDADWDERLRRLLDRSTFEQYATLAANAVLDVDEMLPFERYLSMAPPNVVPSGVMSRIGDELTRLAPTTVGVAATLIGSAFDNVVGFGLAEALGFSLIWHGASSRAVTAAG